MLESRHRALMILIIVLVSVFLFSSCGEPTFCELKDIKITVPTNSNSFKISGTDDDLSLIEEGPGLILCYYITDSVSNLSNITKKAVSVFKTNSDPILFIESDSSIGQLTGISGDSNTYTLYAFKNDSSTNPASPVYNLNLGQYVSGNTLSVEFKFNALAVDWNYKTFTITDSNSNQFTYYFSADDSIAEGTTIVVLAAITSGVGDFSNIYWSELKQVGYYTYQSI